MRETDPSSVGALLILEGIGAGDTVYWETLGRENLTELVVCWNFLRGGVEPVFSMSGMMTSMFLAGTASVGPLF